MVAQGMSSKNFCATAKPPNFAVRIRKKNVLTTSGREGGAAPPCCWCSTPRPQPCPRCSRPPWPRAGCTRRTWREAAQNEASGRHRSGQAAMGDGGGREPRGGDLRRRPLHRVVIDHVPQMRPRRSEGRKALRQQPGHPAAARRAVPAINRAVSQAAWAVGPGRWRAAWGAQPGGSRQRCGRGLGGVPALGGTLGRLRPRSAGSADSGCVDRSPALADSPPSAAGGAKRRGLRAGPAARGPATASEAWTAAGPRWRC